MNRAGAQAFARRRQLSLTTKHYETRHSLARAGQWKLNHEEPIIIGRDRWLAVTFADAASLCHRDITRCVRRNDYAEHYDEPRSHTNFRKDDTLERDGESRTANSEKRVAARVKPNDMESKREAS